MNIRLSKCKGLRIYGISVQTTQIDLFKSYSFHFLNQNKIKTDSRKPNCIERNGSM